MNLTSLNRKQIQVVKYTSINDTASYKVYVKDKNKSQVSFVLSLFLGKEGLVFTRFCAYLINP